MSNRIRIIRAKSSEGLHWEKWLLIRLLIYCIRLVLCVVFSERGVGIPAVWLCTTRPPCAAAHVHEDVAAAAVIRPPVCCVLCFI